MGPFWLKKPEIFITTNNRWGMVNVGKLISPIGLEVSLKVWRFNMTYEKRKMQNIVLDHLRTILSDINQN